LSYNRFKGFTWIVTEGKTGESENAIGETMALRWEPTHVTKHTSRDIPLHLSLKKVRVQKIFSSSQVNCSGARCKYSVQELRKAHLELHSPEKSGGEGNFGLVRCLDGVTGTREEGLTGDGDGGIGGRVTVRGPLTRHSGARSSPPE